uniref:Uncharacterized protein n=1 Tax=Solanum lycopersicum TaxID=4081 RepID=A0A3Q7IXQ9_SOLLC
MTHNKHQEVIQTTSLFSCQIKKVIKEITFLLPVKLISMKTIQKTISATQEIQLQSALRRFDKYIFATQTISHLEDEHPHLKKQREIN